MIRRAFTAGLLSGLVMPATAGWFPRKAQTPGFAALNPVAGSVGVNPLLIFITGIFDISSMFGGSVLFQLFEVGNPVAVKQWTNADIGSSLFLSSTNLFLNNDVIPLNSAAHYCIKASPGSVVSDPAGEPWPGITDETTWDFVTA